MIVARFLSSVLSYVLLIQKCIFSKLPLSPSGRGAVPSFSRNVPERSTFHSGMTRTAKQSRQAYGIPTSSQDTSAINPASRPSNFFSKLSSKFSKRSVVFFIFLLFNSCRFKIINNHFHFRQFEGNIGSGSAGGGGGVGQPSPVPQLVQKNVR